MHQDLIPHSDTYHGTKGGETGQTSPNSSYWAPSKAEGSEKTQSVSFPFVPTINAITSSQELQWMIHPAVLTSGSCLRSLPCDHLDASRLGLIAASGTRVIQTVGSTHRPRRHHHLLKPDEEEKRRLRRERNKLAAAKCRNRRRELTEQLEEETEGLEREQASLKLEVKELQEERERLEVLLASHTSVCPLVRSDAELQHHQPSTPLFSTLHVAEASDQHRVHVVKQEPRDGMLFPHPQQSTLRLTSGHAEELCPGVECLSDFVTGCRPSVHLMDQTSTVLPMPSMGLQDRVSTREGDTISKLSFTSTAINLEEGPLEQGPLPSLFPSNLLTL